MDPSYTSDHHVAAPRDRNRSLVRGIAILRAFRPGADLMGNGELAERTGLPPATVSRLVQTLVDCGMLDHDRRRRAYRLAVPILTLAHAMRTGSHVLQVAGPLMRKVAESRQVNVGIAVADGEDMVYLESVRYARRVSWRNVVAGQRVPIELTSLGRAWLAAAPMEERQRLFRIFSKRRRSEWRRVRDGIEAASRDVRDRGYCWASWQPDVVAVATPVLLVDARIYVLNMSVTTTTPAEQAANALSPELLALATEIRATVNRRG